MLYSCPCLRRASLERLPGTMDHDLGDVGIAVGLVNGDICEPLVQQADFCLHACVLRLHLLDDELDENAQLLELLLVYLVAVALPDFVELEALDCI